MIPREIILARNAFASLMAVYNVITGRTSINYVYHFDRVINSTLTVF